MEHAEKEGLPNKKLLNARLERHWSQRDLAAHLGTTFVNISRWERGITTPGIYYRQKLCLLFGKQPQELGLRDREERTTPSVEHGTLLPFPTLHSQPVLPLWHVPSLRNPFFTGREDMLQQVHALLKPDASATTSHSVALSGLGGIGKTQTALEYAYRYAHAYAAVFWVNAESFENLATGFADVADLLNLPEKQEQTIRHIITAVIRWLNGHTGWLLIFDNVEDMELLKDFLPPAPRGSLLLTSRRQALAIAGQLFNLDTLTTEESLHLLLARSRRLHSPLDLHRLSPEDHATALRIVVAMDGLPLALDQAGAYIEATQCSLADYEQLLHIAPLSLLAERELSAEHPLSVVKTFGLAFEQLAQTHPEAVELLLVCTYLAPESIPEAFFLQGAAQLGPTFETFVSQSLRFHAAIKALLTYSFLQRDSAQHTLTIHRLMQAVLKSYQVAALRYVRFTRVLDAMEHLFPRDDEEQANYWQICATLLPHALACIQHWEEITLPELHLIDWINRVASYLVKCARYAEAEHLFQQTLQAGEQKAELESSKALLASSLHGLGDIRLKQGKLKEAEVLFLRAVELRRQILGEQHDLLAASLNRLGVLYWEQSHYEQAEQCYTQALHIWENVLGPEHPRVTRPLNNLTILYIKLEKYEEAEQVGWRALAMRERKLGTQHPQVASMLNTLGVLLMNQGRYAEAEPLFQRALQIWEQTLGATHPQLADALNNLAILRANQKQYREAEPYFQRALHIREQHLGPDHPQLALLLHNLARSCQKQGKYVEAETLLERVLHMRERTLAADHLDIAYTLYDLADLWETTGKAVETQPLFSRALDIFTHVLGPEHRLTCEARQRLHISHADQI